MIVDTSILTFKTWNLIVETSILTVKTSVLRVETSILTVDISVNFDSQEDNFMTFQKLSNFEILNEGEISDGIPL